MRKKIIHFALAFVLVLCLCFAAACGQEKENEGNKNPGGNDSETVNPDKNPGSSQKPGESEKPEENPGESQGGSEKPDTSDNPSDNPGGSQNPGESENPEEDKNKDDGWVSAIFGGDPFVTGGEKVAEDMKHSGFDTMIIWSVHVKPEGILVLNDTPICDNGKVLASEETLKMWSGLKEGDSCIERVELSVGAYGNYDFDEIKNYIDRDGTGRDTVLYKNIKALADATGADAINYDDETCYDLESATAFGEMCADMGLTVALCPFDMNQYDFWVGLKENLGDIVDRVYLQCYDGGAQNMYSWDYWSEDMGMEIIPGFWCGNEGQSGRDTAKSVAKRLEEGVEYICGGFIWYYDDIQNLPSPNSLKDYAKAINGANPDGE